jgi:hypothetical protein
MPCPWAEPAKSMAAVTHPTLAKFRMVARTIHLGIGSPVPNHHYAIGIGGCERKTVQKGGKIRGGDERVMRTIAQWLTCHD